MLKMW